MVYPWCVRAISMPFIQSHLPARTYLTYVQNFEDRLIWMGSILGAVSLWWEKARERACNLCRKHGCAVRGWETSVRFVCKRSTFWCKMTSQTLIYYWLRAVRCHYCCCIQLRHARAQPCVCVWSLYASSTIDFTLVLSIDLVCLFLFHHFSCSLSSIIESEWNVSATQSASFEMHCQAMCSI